MATVTEKQTVQAVPREAKTKNYARRVRKAGQVPAVIYGAGKEPAAISLDPKQIAAILQSETGHNTIFDVELDGERSRAMIVDWQYEPIKGALLHCDLKRIAMDQRLRVSVPIALKGDAIGVKQQGGILEQVTREVELECLPEDIPSHIDVDVTDLGFGKVIRVADLPHGEGKLRFLTDENLPVAHIIAVKEHEVAAVEAGAAPETAAAAPAEPEVIKKGKAETEEEGAEEGSKEGSKEGGKKPKE